MCAYHLNVIEILHMSINFIDVLYPGYLGTSLGDGVEFKGSSLSGAGDGLFTLRAFRKGEVVTFYDGTLLHILKITGKYNTALCGAGNWSHWRSVPERDLVIKGVSRRNGACNGRGGGSIANHFPEKQNCAFKYGRFTVPMFCEEDFEWTMVRPTLLVAITKLAIGEEIFVDYGGSRMAAHEIPSHCA